MGVSGIGLAFSRRHHLWSRHGVRVEGWRRKTFTSSPRLLHRGQTTGASPPSSFSNNTASSGSRSKPTSSRFRSYFSPVLKWVGWYTRQQRDRPYVTELCSTITIYCIGDLSAQIIAADEDTGYDPHRTARSIIIGALAAIPTQKWFRFLGQSFNYSSRILSTCTKVAVHQLVYTTLFNVYFFASHAILSGTDISGTIERVRNTVPTSLPRSFLYWPFVTAFNFTYVKPQSRSVVTAVFAVFWQAYMSWLNARAHEQEKGHA